MTQRLLRFLQKNDPGLFRLTHAAKTILAIALTLSVLYPCGQKAMLYGGLTSGFSMQGIIDYKRSKQMLSALIFYVYTLIAYTAGAFAKPDPHIVMLVLATFGFLAFALSIISQRFKAFPIFTWIICYLSTIFQSKGGFDVFRQEQFLLVGFCFSFLVSFFVFPKHNITLFYKQFILFVEQCRDNLTWVSDTLSKPIKASSYRKMMTSRFEAVETLITKNQPIVEQALLSKSAFSSRVKELYLLEYTLGKSIAMIMSTRHEMLKHHITPSSCSTNTLLPALDQFSRYFNHININVKKHTLVHAKPTSLLQTDLAAFKQHIQKQVNNSDSRPYLVLLDYCLNLLLEQINRLEASS
jgi:hypothetical protein